MADLTQQTLEKAKGLAPWRPNLPWWVVLIEGLAIGGMGVLLIWNPDASSINAAIFFTAVLLIIGIVQLWAVIRNKLPEHLDGMVAARGAIATFAGATILLLLYLDLLTLGAGRVIFGLAAIVFGILGILIFFGGGQRQLRSVVIDSLFFLVAGAVMLYAQWHGGEFVTAATSWLGWLSLAVGLGLIGYAIWRLQKDKVPAVAQPS